MDIITLAQSNLAYLVVAVAVAFAAWKWYRMYTSNRANRLDVLHYKKIAGNITSSEREYLENNQKHRKRKKLKLKLNFSWRGIDIRAILSKLNPLKSIEKQIKELRRDHDSVRRSVNSVRWDLGDRITNVESQLKEDEPKEEESTKEEVESHLVGVSFGGSKFA